MICPYIGFSSEALLDDLLLLLVRSSELEEVTIVNIVFLMTLALSRKDVTCN